MHGRERPCICVTVCNVEENKMIQSIHRPDPANLIYDVNLKKRILTYIWLIFLSQEIDIHDSKLRHYKWRLTADSRQAFMYLLIFVKVALLALGQSYDCPSASEVILKDMGKLSRTIYITKRS